MSTEVLDSIKVMGNSIVNNLLESTKGKVIFGVVFVAILVTTILGATFSRNFTTEYYSDAKEVGLIQSLSPNYILDKDYSDLSIRALKKTFTRNKQSKSSKF